MLRAAKQKRKCAESGLPPPLGIEAIEAILTVESIESIEGAAHVSRLKFVTEEEEGDAIDLDVLLSFWHFTRYTFPKLPWPMICGNKM